MSTERSNQAQSTRTAGGKARVRRSRGTREQTEEALRAAALRALERTPPLAGINIRKIAEEAGVNHGQIYQYFGTRQALLRAAIRDRFRLSALERRRHWELPWAERKRRMWRWALEQRDAIRLLALLALDDNDVDIFPELELTKQALERDRRTGALSPDSDPLVAHAMASVVYYGYAIFRTAIAHRLEISEEELDRRAAAVYDQMLEGMAAPRRDDERGGPSAFQSEA